MRLFEIASTAENNLVTALELIRQRYKDENALPSISTDSLIKSFDRTKVTLKPFGDEPGTPEQDPTTNVPDPEAATNTVDSMAKRAAKQRGGSI